MECSVIERLPRTHSLFMGYALFSSRAYNYACLQGILANGTDLPFGHTYNSVLWLQALLPMYIEDATCMQLVQASTNLLMTATCMGANRK